MTRLLLWSTLSLLLQWIAARPAAASNLGPDAVAGTAAPGAAGPATHSLAYQQALRDWWTGAGRLWLDESAYRIEEDLVVQDGVCRATLTRGIAIPVWSGRPPVGERIVGFVYIGDGRLEVDIPARADRWRVANHAARTDILTRAEQAAIVHGGAPLAVGIERGVVLSADPALRALLAGLEPVGGGTMIQLHDDAGDGSDETYLVTDSRGRLRARAVATNMLPNRRRLLQRSGLDPRIWLRQDRLLTDELGVPGDAVRFVADWRTDHAFRVAAQLGAGVAGNDFDRWLTCFRDPLDQEGLGYASQAFAHGTDPEGIHHFERFSGIPLAPPDARPGAWLEGVSADVTVTTRPKGFGNERFVDVDEILELRAVNGPVAGLSLSMPVSGAVRGTWRLRSLREESGRELARVALTEDLYGRGSRSGTTADRPVDGEIVADAANEGTDAAEPVADDATDEGSEGAPPAAGGGEVGGGLAPATTDALGSADTAPLDTLGRDIEASLGLGAADEQALIRDTPIEHIVQVVLPEPVPEGATTRIHIQWSARWPFAHWSSGREVLGATTGMQRVVPDPVPAPGGSRWDTRIRVGLPAAGLFSLGVAVAGDTVREWDEDTWSWIEAAGEGVGHPAVAIGRWQTQVDPPGMGMPAVRVHLFARDAWALPQFPPEVRRIVSFFDRFLPSLPLGEIEVFEGPSVFTGDFLSGDQPAAGHGLLAVRTVKTRRVTDQSRIDEVDPYATQTMIARQVAAQHWGQHLRPESSRDLWLVDGLAEAFASFYVRGAFGNDAYTERMEALRKLIEDPVEYASNRAATNRWRRFLSLTGATPASDVSPAMRRRYGAYVAADILRLHVGDQAFFSALDHLAAEDPDGIVTTVEVQAALEAASGEDLGEMFDWWVHGGFIPKVRADVWTTPAADGTTTVHGCLHSDPPWGSFDIPVEVVDQEGGRSVSALVDIDDGLGRFVVEGRHPDAEVHVDPLGLVVAYARDVRTVRPGRCARD
ncbi:MAG: hypothetical protein D6798_03710 [Deltaproteobacteria bacterium]|nr:MAG: hypothetical protein D6798_03710 [Deltaproteobacteria bacterium]